MQEFIEFDCCRLNAFSRNKTVSDYIHIEIWDGVKLLKFKPIHYFNYAFIGDFNFGELIKIEDYYKNVDVLNFKIIIDSSKTEFIRIIDDMKQYRLSQVIGYFRGGIDDLERRPDNLLDLVEVDDSNIDLYKEVYLDVFDAENIHPESALENLRLALSIKNFKAFIAIYKNEVVGICSFRVYNGNLMFTAGGLKQKYRGLGIQKMMFHKRKIMAESQWEFDEISSWAYRNTSSFNNLTSFGLVNTLNFNVYEFIGTSG